MWNPEIPPVTRSGRVSPFFCSMDFACSLAPGLGLIRTGIPAGGFDRGNHRIEAGRITAVTRPESFLEDVGAHLEGERTRHPNPCWPSMVISRKYPGRSLGI